MGTLRLPFSVIGVRVVSESAHDATLVVFVVSSPTPIMDHLLL